MSVALASASIPNSTRQEPLRVMVVDDSVVIRGLISRWIASEPDMVVAASLRTGLDAVNQIERINPDVAVLDIEMPELDGISALPLLLAKKRNLRHHHGLDADPPQRRDQLQGAVARRLGLHAEAGEHPRAGRRRNLPPRSDPEDPLARRQGPPRRRRPMPAPRWHRAWNGRASPPRPPPAPIAQPNCCAVRSARKRRARC